MIGGYHPFFHQELIRRIAKDRAEKAATLGERYAQTWEDYHYGCGVIAGLQAALDIADEIKREIDQG